MYIVLAELLGYGFAMTAEANVEGVRCCKTRLVSDTLECALSETVQSEDITWDWRVETGFPELEQRSVANKSKTGFCILEVSCGK